MTSAINTEWFLAIDGSGVLLDGRDMLNAVNYANDVADALEADATRIRKMTNSILDGSGSGEMHGSCVQITIGQEARS